MPFIRRQVIGGSTYYQYLRAYRKGKKVELRVTQNLGKHLSLQSALNEANKIRREERLRRLEGMTTKGGVRRWHLSGSE